MALTVKQSDDCTKEVSKPGDTNPNAQKTKLNKSLITPYQHKHQHILSTHSLTRLDEILEEVPALSGGVLVVLWQTRQTVFVLVAIAGITRSVRETSDCRLRHKQQLH